MHCHSYELFCHRKLPNAVGSAPCRLTLLQKLLTYCFKAHCSSTSHRESLQCESKPLSPSCILTVGSVFEAQYSVCAASRGDRPASVSAE